MHSARRVTAMVFGLFAGAASVEHGIGEALQGNVAPGGLMIASWGPPCDPEQVWHLCEPAMTVIPNFLITGILAILFGVAALIWSGAFLRRRGGGAVLIALSILMLLFGGGMFPPLIGIIGGGMAMLAADARRPRPAGAVTRALAALWPWPLVVTSVYLVGQWGIGYFFNDWMMSMGFVMPAFILVVLALSAITAAAQDRVRAAVGG